MKNYKILKEKIITLFDFIEGKSVKVSREIASIQGNPNGPNLVFVGGIHGNEPSGVLALYRVMEKVRPLKPLLQGNVYALAGNLNALEKGERYIVNDLNRIWQAEKVEKARIRDYKPTEIINEVEEQIELWAYIDDLMNRKQGRFIFVDLHTTSSVSIPFITMSDTIMNRSFAQKIPVPIVLGVENYLNEPLLSYLTDLGCISMAFEAGQHTDNETVKNHEAMIWLSLVQAGIIQKKEIRGYRSIYHKLELNANKNKHVYAIHYRQHINPGEEFRMVPGYTNFQAVHKGQHLATLDGKPVPAQQNGLIWMPLYQSQGSDGYFLIQKIARIWLFVSYFFRKMELYRILRYLPGVKPFMETKHIMVVNTQVAKVYSKQILNLMGYRRTKKQGNLTLYIRRKYDTRNQL